MNVKHFYIQCHVISRAPILPIIVSKMITFDKRLPDECYNIIIVALDTGEFALISPGVSMIPDNSDL